MNKPTTYIFYSILVCCLYWGCKKEEAAKTDDRLNSNTYCNDPQAINYNWGFPGVPDNSKCIFPTQVFKGSYLMLDSVMDADFKFKRLDTLHIGLVAVNNIAMKLTGFCNGEISLTADRYYKSTVDSLSIDNSGLATKLNGQYLCGNTKDTVSGFISRNHTDSTKITLYFTVATDSGIIYHQGSGTRK